MTDTTLPQPSFLHAAWSLASRELTTFFRQRSRVVGAILTPILFWVMLGMGMGKSFQPSRIHMPGGFLEYFFPGIVVFSVVFAGMYSTISTIQDRQTGFLQAVLVAPIPRTALVVGKVLGGAMISLIQGALLLPLAFLSGVPVTATGLVLAVFVLALISLAMTGLGFVFAWKIDSVQGYHAIMNLILMPMWMLSGAFFPVGGAAGWVRGIMTINPLVYGLAALRHVLYLGDASVRDALPPLSLCLAVTAACGLLGVVASARAVAARPEG